MTLDDVISLSPSAEMFRRHAREELRDTTTRELVTRGVYLVEARTAGLCAAYFHVLPPKPRDVRSVVQNGLFTAVALALSSARRRPSSTAPRNC